jgi:hypothetical protein
MGWRQELRPVWPHVRSGGAVVVDDVDINEGFRIFVAEMAHARSWLCEAEPIRPANRRSNNRDRTTKGCCPRT